MELDKLSGRILNVGLTKMIDDRILEIGATSYGAWYGVEWDNSISTSDCTRIGNTDLHRSLPVQNGMKAVILKDDGTINYELNPNDWREKINGGSSILDGTDGQVMIYIPSFYFKYETEGTIERWKISEFALPGYSYFKGIYISAYEAALDRTNLKLSSVVNTTAQFRGGNNTSDWDELDKTLLGRPVTNLSRTNLRTYARNRGAGWEMYNYYAHFRIMILFVIEYATRNSQKAINLSLDPNGYKQGGLGNGVTNLNSTNWNNWNAYNPFIPCGYSNELGSYTNEMGINMPAGYGATLTTYVNRYRGIELPFGHIWKNCDGINIRIGANDDADPASKSYVSDNPLYWNDSNFNNMLLIGEIARTEGYIKQVIPNSFLPKIVGGGSTIYWADYAYTYIPSSSYSLRTLLLGGAAHNGAIAGLGFSFSNYSPSYAYANIGSRLCFMPA